MVDILTLKGYRFFCKNSILKNLCNGVKIVNEVNILIH